MQTGKTLEEKQEELKETLVEFVLQWKETVEDFAKGKYVKCISVILFIVRFCLGRVWVIEMLKESISVR